MFVESVWGRAILRGTDTECYCVCFDGLGREIQRGTDTEYYCVCCEGRVEGNIERN